MALIGNQSSFPVNRGVQLLNGPSIDPGFNAPLDLALLNLSDEDVYLDLGDPIGKILFFDISDTGLQKRYKRSKLALARSKKFDAEQ